MRHEDFVRDYHGGRLRCHVDKSAAMRVCDSKLMPKHYRFAHHFWKSTGCLLPLVGIAAFFFAPRWVGALLIFGGFLVVLPAVRQSASENLLAYALEDASFYDRMLSDGVIRITTSKNT